MCSSLNRVKFILFSLKNFFRGLPVVFTNGNLKPYLRTVGDIPPGLFQLRIDEAVTGFLFGYSSDHRILDRYKIMTCRDNLSYP